MNLKPFAVLLFMAPVFATGYAQTTQTENTPLAARSFAKPTSSDTEKDRANMIKLNLSTFILKGIGVQYERKIGQRTSLALGISIIPTSTVAFKNLLEKTIDNPRVNVDQFKVGATVFTPELRYYFGTKGTFHGFYIAPYFRLGNYHIEGPVTYNSSTGSVRTAVFNGNLSFYSGGLMIGSNFQLSNNIYLDWWILGVGFGAANGNVHATTSLNVDEQKSLKDQLDRANVPMTTTSNEVNANGATVTSTGSVVGARGLGINIGIRF